MKSKNSITYTARIRAQFHADEAAVRFYTGITTEQLTYLKLDIARQWIIKYCIQNSDLSTAEAGQVWTEPVLLRWWQLEWRLMDHSIILPILHKILPQEREAVYKETHRSVLQNNHPYHQLLELSLLQELKKIMQSNDWLTW